MKIMFHMMNSMRIEIGISALSQASAAYLLALNYARERTQGKDIENLSDHVAKPGPIIQHPDVRRNLLKMKAYVCGMRSFFYYVSMLEGPVGSYKGDEARKFREDLLSLYTPVLKEYVATKSHDICIHAMQVFGGAGYTRDYPVEQYARDSRIHSIFEGTSGIQAMDLVARKLQKQDGQVFELFLKEVRKVTQSARQDNRLSNLAEKTETAANCLADAAVFIRRTLVSPKVKIAFAHSLPFLHAMGDTIMAWMLLWRATVSVDILSNNPRLKDRAFYQGQINTAEFFIRTLLPAGIGTMKAILDGCDAAIEIENDAF
jgi:hypothetical protein